MSVARQGLDRLLAEYPTADVVRVQHQEHPDPFYAAVAPTGPWTEVDLMHSGARKRFAIWNRTGNVYRCDRWGAVEDEPFIVVTVGGRRTSPRLRRYPGA